MSCKLTYFNLKGLGEPIRFLRKYGNIEFEDVRIEPEDWPKFKDCKLTLKCAMRELN